MSYTRNGYTYGNGWGRPATEGEMALEAAQRIETALEAQARQRDDSARSSQYWAGKATEYRERAERAEADGQERQEDLCAARELLAVYYVGGNPREAAAAFLSRVDASGNRWDVE